MGVFYVAVLGREAADMEGYSRGGWGRSASSAVGHPLPELRLVPPLRGTGRDLGQDAWAGAGLWGVTCQAEAWHIMPADRPAPPLRERGPPTLGSRQARPRAKPPKTILAINRGSGLQLTVDVYREEQANF